MEYYEFNEPLFGCLSDCKLCFCAILLPGGICCIQARAVHEATGQDLLSALALPWIVGCLGAAINREKIRFAYNIKGNLFQDLCLECFCPICAVTQEALEVRHRNLL